MTRSLAARRWLSSRIRDLRAVAHRKEVNVIDVRELLQIAERLFASERNRHTDKHGRRLCTCVDRVAREEGAGVLVECSPPPGESCGFGVWWPREHLEAHARAVA